MFLFIKFIAGPVAVFLSALVILAFFTNVPRFRVSDLPYYQLYFSPPTTKCDIFQGEWVPDMDAPYYTNTTCSMIQEHQNCMKFGRPDRDFLKWRWKPAGCDLPRFDGERFLEVVGNKSLAFVGDSLARNHMQSLLCLLSQVVSPKDVSLPSSTYMDRIWHFERYNFTIYIFWSPFLVRAELGDKDGPAHTGLWKLYLDEPDGKWMSGVTSFDYLIISVANWFTRPSLFYEKGQLVGCSYCALNISRSLTLRYSHRMAFRTALRAINDLDVRFGGMVIVRTLSPMSHFEGGAWDKGGHCDRTRPYRSNETRISPEELELYTGQVEEFRAAEKAARARAVRMVLMDTTGPMLMRPDGHPSRYGHWPKANMTLYNDCIHWCLPGPIDAWNDMLLHMLAP